MLIPIWFLVVLGVFAFIGLLLVLYLVWVFWLDENLPHANPTHI